MTKDCYKCATLRIEVLIYYIRYVYTLYDVKFQLNSY